MGWEGRQGPCSHPQCSWGEAGQPPDFISSSSPGNSLLQKMGPCAGSYTKACLLSGKIRHVEIGQDPAPSLGGGGDKQRWGLFGYLWPSQPPSGRRSPPAHKHNGGAQEPSAAILRASLHPGRTFRCAAAH